MIRTRPAIAFGLALTAALPLPAHAAPDPEGRGVAWRIVADLTSEIGERLAATPREAAAREWAQARLKALGFANVRIEPYTMPGWVRGEESAMLAAPLPGLDQLAGAVPQRLALTALGNSGATPAAGITAQLVYFPTLAALQAAPDGAVKGRIAFIDNAMRATQDGSAYGPYGAARRQGPAIAAAKGAVAVLIRSIGTDHNRDPHTGVTNWPEGVTPIAAAAVSAPDADLVARIAGSGRPMALALTLTPRFTGDQPSGNVVAELPGRDPKLPPILVACHLDSWDLATGAIDDGAGCTIVTAAALQARKPGQLLRTIRVLWAGAEERGGFGGAAYGKAHGTEPHAVAMESDFGADRVWRVNIGLGAANKPLADRIAATLGAMGVVRGDDKVDGGTDVEGIVAAQHVAIIDLNQDGTRYFDLHHTPDDTLDKIDPAQLQQNVDCWAAVLKIVGEEAGEIIAAK